MRQLEVLAYESMWIGCRVGPVWSLWDVLEAQNFPGGSEKTPKSAVPNGCEGC